LHIPEGKISIHAFCAIGRNLTMNMGTYKRMFFKGVVFGKLLEEFQLGFSTVVWWYSLYTDL
jgi:hypothetical protein